MSRFHKPDYDIDKIQEARIVRAKPIDPKNARKLGSLGVGKDFVMGSKTNQQEFSGDNHGKHVTSYLDEKSKLEICNKLNAKILKARLHNKMDVVEKLEKELQKVRSGEEVSQQAASQTKIMLGVNKSGLRMPVSSGKHTKAEEHGFVDSSYRSCQSLDEMRKEEATSTSSDDVYNAAMMAAKQKIDHDWTVDDAMLSVKRSKKNEDREERRYRSALTRENVRDEQTLDSCQFCLESCRFKKHCLVATARDSYLLSVPWKPLIKEHCLIVPIAHCCSVTELDEDVYEEIRAWKRGLVEMWGKKSMGCLFFETAKNVKHRKHTFVECVGIPDEIYDMAPLYFKEGIDNCETEWSNNTKKIKLSERGGDVRKAIPRGLSYFAVDFGLQPGYAHVIENEQLFPNNFAHEIIKGMLAEDPLSEKKEMSYEEKRANTVELKKQWEPFDWTKTTADDSLKSRKRKLPKKTANS